MQETPELWVGSLGWEEPVEEKMATHYSITAWKIPWTEETLMLQPMGSQRVRHADKLILLNCGVGEDSWESPDCKEIQPVHPKGDQSWVFIGRTDAEAETPTLWPPDVKSWLIWKDPDAGKDWGQEAKGTTEEEMVEWNHRLNGHEFG